MHSCVVANEDAGVPQRVAREALEVHGHAHQLRHGGHEQGKVEHARRRLAAARLRRHSASTQAPTFSFRPL